MKPHQHFILHKPYGFLSQFIRNETTRKNKKLLAELGDFPDGTMSVGRLDQDSEGLLFLTTDGKTSFAVTANKQVEKEYFVQVDGEITSEAIELLKNGVEISVKKEQYTTLPCKAFKIEPKPNFSPRAKPIRDERHGPTSWVSITIKEGKFRQVRKMTAAVGFPTLRLIRVRIGNETLGDLKSGEFVEVDKLNF
ncbi:MAG: pseudouridine synthase [Flavobacteriales bacterium]